MDIISILATAKELGLSTGNILSFVIMGYVIKKELTKQIDKIVDAIRVHNERFDILEKDVHYTKTEIHEIKKTINNIITEEK